MAKDDYNVIVYKILLYLYAVFKRKIVFDEVEFKASILKKSEIEEEYLISILNLMQEEDLIKGLVLKNVWGNELVLINDLCNMRITSKGIEYITENKTMKKVEKFLLESVDMFAPLIKKIFPFQ